MTTAKLSAGEAVRLHVVAALFALSWWITERLADWLVRFCLRKRREVESAELAREIEAWLEARRGTGA